MLYRMELYGDRVTMKFERREK